MLQAKSLGISYNAYIMDEHQSSQASIPGIHRIDGLVGF
jgi:hypothetical protein